MSANGMGGIRNDFFGQFFVIFAITYRNMYNNTLHSWIPRNIMGGICKKNQLTSSAFVTHSLLSLIGTYSFVTDIFDPTIQMGSLP